jgi:hypothetical protein
LIIHELIGLLPSPYAMPMPSKPNEL